MTQTKDFVESFSMHLIQVNKMVEILESFEPLQIYRSKELFLHIREQPTPQDM